MTALQKYQRIEASGLWRPNAQAQRREVIVSIGDATLVITDTKEQALAHWSLAAVARANPGDLPAIYHPDGDPDEVLELSANETQMIDAIEKLRQAINRTRPKPGRLRLYILGGVITLALALAVFWLPGAMLNHAARVVPDAKRSELGDRLLGHAQRVTGQACQTPAAETALRALARRVAVQDTHVSRIVVMRSGVSETVLLPGRILLISRRLIEDYEDPGVAAGFITAELVRSRQDDPLKQLLSAGGFLETLRLLTTGTLPDDALAAYAETVLSQPRSPIPDDALLVGFAAAQLSSTPYAYALDVSGEATLPLIEADPMRTRPVPTILNDADWVRLQEICNG
ncbi:hypothetical protein SAMN06265173_13141 [Thalassovita litoralis]|jgi:hypothetical protein|uniref:Peptidase M48 domain-containing protein n=1 Tax=Thalassovita litoralis TaxID=1010611 RepID=A0A521FKG3_9RHOB|nr:hypothetical protein [Thalassovita litoralis]SMO96100.1 hypothetical protein SAMN06265173_13141 [Thalassovita litoralis]